MQDAGLPAYPGKILSAEKRFLMNGFLRTFRMMQKYLILLLLFFLIELQLPAQNSSDMRGFYGSLNMGVSQFTGNVTSYETGSSTRFAMHFNIGYFVTNNFQLGLTGSGWLFESFMWTGKEYTGESISNTMLHVQFYPVQHYRWFVKGAYGVSKYTNLHPDKDSGRGNAFMAASGYEKKPGKGELLLGILISYQWGKLKYGNLYTPANQLNRSFNVVDLTLFFGLD
jgi:hypothetical protein